MEDDLSVLHLVIKEKSNDNQIDLVRFLLENVSNLEAKTSKSHTPLHFAVLYKKMEVVKLLIKEGAYINATDNFNNTPLHMAIFTNSIEIGKLLVKKKANLEAKDNWGFTPLQKAIRQDDKKFTKLLMNHGAIAVNPLPYFGLLPLEFAIHGNRPNVVCFFVQNVLHIDFKTKYLMYNGLTPLEKALDSEHRKKMLKVMIYNNVPI